MIMIMQIVIKLVCLLTNPRHEKEMFGLCVSVGLVVIGVLCYHYCFGVSSCRDPINAATHVSMLCMLT